MKDMLDKILQIEEKYKELGITLSDPAVIQDYERFRDLSSKEKQWKKPLRFISNGKPTTKRLKTQKSL